MIFRFEELIIDILNDETTKFRLLIFKNVSFEISQQESIQKSLLVTRHVLTMVIDSYRTHYKVQNLKFEFKKSVTYSLTK